jgi:hypothetical protein
MTSSIRDEEVKDLKAGDVIYECQYATNIEVRLKSAPKLIGMVDGRNQWEWCGENTQTGEVIDYLLTEGLSHYGPRLYRKPQYVRFSGNGQVSFPRLGGADLECEASA